ncbi:hypothetical protein P154DRAFT_615936 [Amniculicola lignicola CBS 123094]|uniref:F-box domain-containing protein n=1 Tax=Amniculicola lignicola CBS 123094 TaxID=1392246 RepID=A0A6A5WY16_9PLEO|nr:hypothetical protein P154DRAFT_615936 [Amniculicola lignicola CBS 123094]
MEVEIVPTRSQFDLYSFADELLLCIIEQINCRDTLCSLSATCSRLQGLTEPYIWGNLFVMRGDHARRIVQACSSEPHRLSLIQELSIRYKHTVESGIEVLDTIMYQLEKLRHLQIESPCPNNDPWRNNRVEFNSYTRIDYTSLFEASVGTISPVPFGQLQSITLHGHNQDKPFVFGRNAIMFTHPTLRNITLSCCDFEAEVSLEDIPKDKLNSTPLKSLTFIECNIYLKLLDIILCLPKALEELSLGERIYHFDGCWPKPFARTSHPRLPQVLQRQAPSLQRIEHSGKFPSYHDPLLRWNASQFSDFPKITHLEISINSLFVTALQRGHYPRSLEHLKLTDRGSTYYSGIDVFREFETAFQCLNTMVDVDLLFTHFGLLGNKPLESLVSQWVEKEVRKQFHRMSDMVVAKGRRFRVFAHSFGSNESFIPPYMYGESTPKEILIYDSVKKWDFYETNYEKEDNEALKAVELADTGDIEMSDVGVAVDGSPYVN